MSGAMGPVTRAVDTSSSDAGTHIADTSAAHAASAVSADSTTLVGTGTDVQAVLEELDNGVADHLAATAGAHLVGSYKSGYYLSFPITGVGTTAPGQDVLNAVRIHVPKAVSVDRIAVEVTTLAALSTVRLGIYADSSSNGLPGALLLDAGTVDSTGTGVLQATISQALTPGTWWLACVSQGGDPTLRVASSAPVLSIWDSTGTAFGTGTHNYQALVKLNVSGALPDPFGTVAGLGPMPRIAVRLV